MNRTVPLPESNPAPAVPASGRAAADVGIGVGVSVNVAGDAGVASRRSALALFAVASLLFGTAFVGIKTGLTALPPLSFAALRFEAAAVVLLSYAALRRSYWRPRTGADYRAVLVAAAFLVAISGASLFLGQGRAPAAVAAVLYGLAPVAAALFALALLPGERLSRTKTVGVLLGLIGVAVAVDPRPALLTAAVDGEGLVVLSALSVALGSVLLRRIDPPMPTLPLTAWAMLLGGVAVHVAALAAGESLAAVAWTPEVAVALLYVAALSTAVGFPAYFALIERAGPVRANLVSYAVPVVAAVAGRVVLGERLATATVVGFLIVAAGFALVEGDAALAALRRRRRGRRRPGRDSRGTDPDGSGAPERAQE